MTRTPPAPRRLPEAPVGEVEVPVLLHRLDPDLPVPTRAADGDAGVDLLARIDVDLPPGARALVPTGVAVALPAGWAAFVHPRSGLAWRHGITVVNAPGTVDAGYRGEIAVNLLNTDPQAAVTIRRGDRIAQLVVQQVAVPRFVEVERLPGSGRGSAGHGSTGGFSGDQPPPAPLPAPSGGAPGSGVVGQPMSTVGDGHVPASS